MEATSKHLPPGPRLPTAIQTLLFGVRTVAFMEACAHRYGDVFTARLPGGPSVWVTDPAVIKRLYARDRDNLVSPQAEPALEPMFGLRSVFLADGAEHGRKRKLLMPAFHGERMAAWRGRMLAVADREVDRWTAGSRLVLHPRMTAITEDVIFEVVFGLGAGEREERLRHALTEMVEAAMRAAGVLLGFIDRGSRVRRLPLTPWGRYQRMIDRTDALLYEEIRVRRADPGLAERDDVFSTLVQAVDERGEPMDDEELRDELMSLLLAGAESSATTLAWAFDLLGRHPEALRRARADEAYLDAVLQETMRLRPVAHMTGRRLATEFRVGPYTLPAGMTVAIPAYLVHHRPDVYPDPYAFRPERFLDAPPGAFGWVPFGGGARRCVGASFATLEMKCVLSTVLRRVSLRPARRRPERVRMRNIILAPARGTRVIVERVEPGQAGDPRAPARPSSGPEPVALTRR